MRPSDRNPVDLSWVPPAYGVIGRLLVGLLFLFPVCAFARGAVVHHQLNVTLHPEKHQLTATDTFTIPGKDDRACFRLASQATVSELTVDGKRVDFSFHDGRLCVPLPTTKADGETRRVIVSYSAVFDDPVPDNPVHSEDPSYGVTATVLPEGTLLLGGAGWYPRLPHREATFTLEARAPAGYQAATAGKCRVRRTDQESSVSVWDIGIPSAGLALSAGPYVITEQQVGDTPVYTYFWPEDQGLAADYLEATAEYIRLYEGLIGAYPYEKFAVVANFFPTGYGFPSYTLLGRRVIRLPFIIETSLGHEIAHSWWGNCVRVDYKRGNWSEGVTTYVADHLYKERESAEAAKAYRLKILRDYAELVPPAEDFPLRQFMSRISPATRVIGYGKGAMVFHMVRRRLGDEKFWEGLKSVFNQKRFQKASWKDFAVIMGQAGDMDLAPFFAQWIDRAGAPVLRLETVRLENGNSAWTVRGRIVQEKPHFSLSIPVEVETPGGRVRQTVSSSSGHTPFAIQTRHRPSRLVVDPDADLFRRLSPTEVPATVNSLKASRRLTVVFAQGISQTLRSAGMELLRGLGQTDARQVTEKQLGSLPTKDSDLLFIGRPKNSESLPAFPPGVSVSANEHMVQGKAYDPVAHAVFLAFSPPQQDGRTVSLFLAPAQPPARAVARKIPHYGKYSYLVFDGENNVLKGTWPPDESPLVHTFSAAPSASGKPR